jgi:hypothetical protein
MRRYSDSSTRRVALQFWSTDGHRTRATRTDRSRRVRRRRQRQKTADNETSNGRFNGNDRRQTFHVRRTDTAISQLQMSNGIHQYVNNIDKERRARTLAVSLRSCR